MTRWLSLMALVGVLLALAALARPAIQRRRSHRPRFEYSGSALSPAAYAELAARPGWAPTALDVAEGVSLRGLVRRPTSAQAAWVLFFPGNDATQLAHGQELLEFVGHGRDWGLLVYAYRGYDSSGGKAGPALLAADGTRVLASLMEREHVTPSRINVVGFSLGGYVAVSTVAEAAREGRQLGSLSLLASVGSVEMTYSGWARRFALGDIYETLPRLAAVPGPVLVVHGSQDASLDVATGRDISSRLGKRARYIEIPGATHELTDHPTALLAVQGMVDTSSLD